MSKIIDDWNEAVEGHPKLKIDPGSSAVDHGQGLPMYNAKNGERMVEATEAQVADTVKRIRATDRGQGPIDAVDTTEADKLWKAAYPLPPEVLAQLQRIEDLVTGTVQLIGSMGSPHCDLEDRLQRIEDMLTKILEEGVSSRHTVRKVHWSDPSAW